MPPVTVVRNKDGSIDPDRTVINPSKPGKAEELKLPPPKGVKRVEDDKGEVDGDSEVDNPPSKEPVSDGLKQLTLTVAIGVVVCVLAWYYAPVLIVFAL